MRWGIRPLVAAAAAAVAAAGLAGCQSLPPSHFGSVTDHDYDTVKPVLEQIMCEIVAARPVKEGNKLVSGNAGFTDGYVVAATITIKSEDSAALTPSLNLIDPFGRTGSSFTSTLGAEIRRNRARSYTQSFLIKVGQVTCPTGFVPLQGGFGLREVIETGVRPMPIGAVAADPAGNPIPPGSNGAPKLVAAFGSTIEFKLTRSISGGPAWVRPLFKGPNGKDGLAQGSWVNTSTLVIAFGPPGEAKLGPGKGLEFWGVPYPDDGSAAAAASANQLLQTMILQNFARPN